MYVNLNFSVVNENIKALFKNIAAFGGFGFEQKKITIKLLFLFLYNFSSCSNWFRIGTTSL